MAESETFPTRPPSTVGEHIRDGDTYLGMVAWHPYEHAYPTAHYYNLWISKCENFLAFEDAKSGGAYQRISVSAFTEPGAFNERFVEPIMACIECNLDPSVSPNARVG